MSDATHTPTAPQAAPVTEARELAGQVAFVTGGATGIGLATARALAARGATVAIFNRNQEKAQAAVAGLRSGGAAAHAFTTDIADPASVEAAFTRALGELQRVDILVNNAGLTRDGLFMRMSDTQWQEVIDTNLGGAFRCARAVARTMMKARYGRIINVSSVVGLVGNAGQANYAASKAGLLGLTKALARELASRGVTVNAVCPGYTDTGLVGEAVANIVAKTGRSEASAREALAARNPQERLVTPGEVAATVAWLCLPESAAITGQAISVSGGEVMH